MKHCAFLTLDEVGDFVIDDEHAIAPLAERGWSVATLSWRQTERAWSGFDAVVIRSTWDYWHDVPAFLDTLASIGRQTRLANPESLVCWNLRKTYLLDLAGKGVTVVETIWLDEFREGFVADCAGRLGTDQLVIKPVVGANGVLIPPDGYMQGVREICDRHGILLIADEVMSGFGRTGKWFAVEHWGVVPDMITMAKGLTSSYVPLGAVAIRREIADAFGDEPFFGGLTYHSHPVGCAAALAVIETL